MIAYEIPPAPRPDHTLVVDKPYINSELLQNISSLLAGSLARVALMQRVW